MHKKHSSCLWCSGFLADGSWPFFTPDHTAKCTYGCRKKNQQVFLYCLSSALWTHHYWPDCETWQVVSKPPREKTAQRLWTGARRFRQTKSICLHRDPATWTHRYLFVQWVKQHRQYWISAETPHANIFQLISADSSGWALGFCAPKCWGEIWPRLEFYMKAYMIPNVRFQREAQWVTLLFRTCVLQGGCCWQWGSGCQGEVPQESARRHLGLRNSVWCIHHQKIGMESLCSWSNTAAAVSVGAKTVKS